MSALRGCENEPRVLFCREVRKGYAIKSVNAVVINPDLKAREMIRILARLIRRMR